MTYLICDEQNRMLTLETKLFGIQVKMAAMFTEEQHALDILFALESRSLLPTPHKVERIEDTFSARMPLYPER